MAIIGGDQGKAGESKGSGRKADDLRLSCLCLLLSLPKRHNKPPFVLRKDEPYYGGYHGYYVYYGAHYGISYV